VLCRSLTDELYPGIWQIVTGTIGETERAVDAALREVMEETRFSPSRFWTVPHVNVFFDRSADAMHLSPMFAMQVEPAAEPWLSDEHSAYEWLTVREAARRLVWPGQRKGVRTVEEFIAGGEEAMRLGEIPL
jgi:8-oxo-dGTP pyrophosphatase MutT (NUDIX family)